jgi:hypothetical protein
MVDKLAPTHTAYGKKYLTRVVFVWLELGTGRLEEDGTFHSTLDRLPIGGFNGYTIYRPIGAGPPEVGPQRPQPDTEDGDLG